MFFPNLLLTILSVFGVINVQIDLGINSQEDIVTERSNDFAPMFLNDAQSLAYYKNLVNQEEYIRYSYNATNVKKINKRTISDTTNIEIKESNQNRSEFVTVMENLGLNGNRVGCGITALATELEYFQNLIGYSKLAISDFNGHYNIPFIQTIVDNSNLLLNGSSGTGMFTWDLFDSLNKTIKRCGLDNKVNTYRYDVINEQRIKDLINQGYPVIWGTNLSAPFLNTPYYGHFMNIYSYVEYTYDTQLATNIKKNNVYA